MIAHKHVVVVGHTIHNGRYFRMKRVLTFLSILLLMTLNWYGADSAPSRHNSMYSQVKSESYLPFNCTLCKMGVRAAKLLLDIHMPDSAIVSAVQGICDTFHIEDKPVCKGAISEFKVCN